MRYLAIVLAMVPGIAFAGQQLPDCPNKFVWEWTHDREAAFQNMPPTPCLFHGDYQTYLCSKSGCEAWHT